MSKPLPRFDLFQYSLLALPLAFAGLPLYIHAPDFYATQAGLSLTLIGSVLLFVRLFDAIQDPVIGFLSNKFANLRSIIMACSLVVMAAGFVMLFHPPSQFALEWFVLSLVLTTTAFSVLSINFNAVGSLWSTDSVQKTRITGWREALGLIGLLVAAILPSVLGLPMSSIVLVFLLAVTGFIFMRWHKSHEDIVASHEGISGIHNWRSLANAVNLRFFGVYSLSMLASAIPAVLVIFFIRDRLDAEALTGLFMLLYFLSGAFGMPLWQMIAQRSSKNNAWMLAMIVSIVTFVGAYFLEAGDVWQYAVICVLSGIALGADLSLPPSILSDMIDRQNARNQTSLYFSVLSFLSKAALALGSFIAFFILGQVSFVPAGENAVTALQSLNFTYALLPCLIKILSVYCLWRISEHKGDENEKNKHNLERNNSYGTHGIS
jgi:GPH family glycoside/pentoside/hexuronide:cation symporter